MSGYSDNWYEANKDNIEKHDRALDLRKRMVSELSPERMIKIMFEGYLGDCTDYWVNENGERLLLEET